MTLLNRLPNLLCRFAVVAGFLAVPGHSMADAWCGYPAPPCSTGWAGSVCYQPPPVDPVCKPKECDKCTGSPCYVGSGVYETAVVDLEVQSGSFPLVVMRLYRSSNLADGALGRGWSSGLAARLVLTPAKRVVNDPEILTQYEAVISMPDGTQYRFLDNALTTQDGGSGVYTAPLGRYETLVRNGDGTYDLTLQRSRSKYRFSSTGALLTMKDEFGNTVTLTYDGNGRLQQVADSSGSGHSMTITWGANSRISSIQDSSGRTIVYQYNLDGMLSSVTNPAGHVTTYTYEASPFAPKLKQVKDHWNRVITDLTWTTEGALRSYTENGETFTYTYQGGSQTQKVDSAGKISQYGFGNRGLITSVTHVGVQQRSVIYNADGSIQQQTDAVGKVTAYTYGSSGQLLSTTRDKDGLTAVRFDYSYDSAFPDQVISVLPKNPQNGSNDPNWQGWQYDYHPTGSLAPGALHHVYQVRDDGVTSDVVATYTYDSLGRVASVTDATGGVTNYAYNATGQLWTVTAPANNDLGTRPVTTYGYDSLGRVSSVTDALGQVTSYLYDTLDRITSVTLPKPTTGSPLNFVTTYTYDNYDSVSGLTFTHVTDPNGGLTKQGYDQFDRLRKSIDALGNATTYTYTKDILSSITDANNNVTSYEYDDFKRLSATVFPDAARETYTYYADGLLKTKTDRKNQTITYEYDGQKRLTKKIYPNSTYIQYTYQGQKLTQVYDNSVSPSETHSFTYDNSFRVTSNTQATRGTIGYAYTPADAVATMTVTGGPTTTYTYYPDGSLNTILWTPVTGQFKYNYRLDGQYQTITFPNGQTRNFAYDNQGRLTQISNLHPTAGNLAAYDYAYDLNHATGANTMLGQRVSMTANVPAQGFTNALHKYYYDANYQLTRVDYPSGAPFNGEVHSWTYDAIGNRLTSTVNGATANYSYQKIGANPLNWNRLASDGVSTHSYDANGNVSGLGAASLTWNHENRLTRIVGAATNDYGYDYQGRRRHKTTGGQTVSFLYDGIQPIANISTPTQHVLMGVGVDELLALSKDGVVEFPVIDDLGSVVAAARNDGSTVDSLVHDAWGKIRSQQGSPSFGYTGREAGEESLMYYRFRYYSPATARFTSEDPLQEYVPVIGGVVYGYVNNSPLLFNDPMGLECTQKMYKDEKKVHHETGEKWELTGSLQYPDLNPLNAPLKGALRILKWKKVKKGLFVYGDTIIECFWAKFFYSTHYWKQDYTLKVVCECPSDSWEYKGSNSGEIKTYKRVIDHAKTFGSIGVTYEPCPKPTW